MSEALAAGAHTVRITFLVQNKTQKQLLL